MFVEPIFIYNPSIDCNRSGIRLIEPGNHPQQGGLSAAGTAKDNGNCAIGNVK
jgi:hypothetical protein